MQVPGGTACSTLDPPEKLSTPQPMLPPGYITAHHSALSPSSRALSRTDSETPNRSAEHL